MIDKILIVTSRSDYTADVVVKRMHERGVEFVRFNTEDFPLRAQASIGISNGKDYLKIGNEKWTLESETPGSVWYRRPAPPDLQNAHLSEEDQRFAIRETMEFTQTLWRLLDHKFWITQPDLLRKVETKALQLKRAAELGFEIPNTLISNDMQEIRYFFHSQGEKVVVKPISHGGYGESNRMAIFANDLGAGFDDSGFDSSNLSPYIIQEKIGKKSDVRLTAFGDRIFSHLITPTGKSCSPLDWRSLAPNELRYSTVETPADVARAIGMFMKSFQLSFGAFDFACKEDGTWVFLEINPNGQWAWLELATGSPMSDALIDLLLENGNGNL